MKQKKENENTNQKHICFELSIRTFDSLISFNYYLCLFQYVCIVQSTCIEVNECCSARRPLESFKPCPLRSCPLWVPKFFEPLREICGKPSECIMSFCCQHTSPHWWRIMNRPKPFGLGKGFSWIWFQFFTIIAFQNRNVKNPSSEGNKNKNMRYAPLLSLSFSGSYDL